MAKDPSFPFYATDFLVDTLRWSRCMKSLHIDLLCESWINGWLANDDGFPYGLNDEDKKAWVLIKHKWVLEDGFWVNKKLAEVKNKRSIYKEKQSKNGVKGGRPPKNNPNETQNNPSLFNNKTQSISKKKPLENEIENRKEIEKGVQGEKEGENIFEPNEPEQESDSLIPEIPITEFTQLSPLQVSTTNQFIALTMHVNLTENRTNQFFEAFKISKQDETGNWKKYYEDVGEIIDHFRNWLKTQKLTEPPHIENGNYYNAGKKLGTSTARVEALKTW